MTNLQGDAFPFLYPRIKELKNIKIFRYISVIKNCTSFLLNIPAYQATKLRNSLNIILHQVRNFYLHVEAVSAFKYGLIYLSKLLLAWLDSLVFRLFIFFHVEKQNSRI